MNALVPRLGDAAETFALRLGAPWRAERCSVGVVHWFRDEEDAVLVVLFDANQAVALHAPYPHAGLRRQELTTLLTRYRGKEAIHLYAAETGLILATNRCPRPAVEYLARLAVREGSGAQAVVAMSVP